MGNNSNSDSNTISTINSVNKKLQYFTNNTGLSLFTIGGIGLLVRLYFFPYNIPITQDGLFYFRYSIDTSILGHLPMTELTNNGWAVFLAVFFSVFHSNNFLDYMTVQRLATVSISILTIIPVYFLCKRFFDKSYALFGAALFSFEPRIIQNSLLGLSEPLFIILTSLSLYLFLSSNKKMIYTSFGVAALATLVRYEGIILFFAISIMFFVRFRRESKIIGKYALSMAIFILVLMPMAILRIQTVGNDGITNSVIGGAEMYAIEATSNGDNTVIGLFLYAIGGLVNLGKFLGFSLVPLFVFFVPLGVVLIFKNRNQSTTTIILSIIILSIPALYAYSRGIQETRYLYVLYPLFCVLSVFTLAWLSNKFKNHNLIIISLITGILFASLIFLDFKKMDYDHEIEAYGIAKHVSKITKVINAYYPESKYVRVTGMVDKFPVLSNSVSYGPKVISTDGFNSLADFIKLNKNNGLTHLILDDNLNRPEFLNDAYYHDEKYPYLTKVFDSSDHGYKYRVKIYKIDYDKFDFIVSRLNK